MIIHYIEASLEIIQVPQACAMALKLNLLTWKQKRQQQAKTMQWCINDLRKLEISFIRARVSLDTPLGFMFVFKPFLKTDTYKWKLHTERNRYSDNYNFINQNHKIIFFLYKINTDWH